MWSTIQKKFSVVFLITAAILMLFVTSCDSLIGGTEEDTDDDNGNGTVQDDSFEPNNTRSDAAPIDLATNISATISFDGDEDWFIFDTANSGEWDWVRFSATNVSSDLNIQMVGYDESGNQVFDTDADTAGADLMYEMPTAGGTYYVKMLSAWSGDTGSYTLRVENVNGNDEYAGNDTRDTAYDLGTLPVSGIEGVIVSSEEPDWYKITTENDVIWDYVQFKLEDVSSELTVKLVVLNSSYNEVINTYASTAGADLTNLLATPGGVYYVKVESNWSGDDGEYTLSIQNQDANDSHEPNDTEDSAKELTLPASDINGTVIWTPGDDDWFTFTSGSSDPITFSVSDVGTNLAAQIEIKEDGGASWTYSGDTGNTITTDTGDSSNLTPAAGETYFVRIGGRWNNDYGDYTLSISQ